MTSVKRGCSNDSLASPKARIDSAFSGAAHPVRVRGARDRPWPRAPALFLAPPHSMGRWSPRSSPTSACSSTAGAPRPHAGMATFPSSPPMSSCSDTTPAARRWCSLSSSARGARCAGSAWSKAIGYSLGPRAHQPHWRCQQPQFDLLPEPRQSQFRTHQYCLLRRTRRRRQVRCQSRSRPDRQERVGINP
jgi:hypothetical protein